MAAVDSFALFLKQVATDLHRAATPTVKGLVVGAVSLKLGYELYKALNSHFFGAFTTRRRLRAYGQWAVITGCTRGLGFEFARQLAALGFDLVLIARRDAVLRELADDLESQYGINTVRITVDLAQGLHVFDEIIDALRTKEIGVLVNNAGLMYDYPQYFAKLDERLLDSMLTVNISSTTHLTHLILKHCMLPRKKGLILCMSSSACVQPTPQITVYAAAKKYVDFFVRGLHAELHGTGVWVQALAPMYCATDMTSYSALLNRPSVFSPSPEVYVRNALWTAGRVVTTTGYFPHTIQVWFLSFIPEWLWFYGAHHLMRYFRRQHLAGEADKGAAKSE